MATLFLDFFGTLKTHAYILTKLSLWQYLATSVFMATLFIVSWICNFVCALYFNPLHGLEQISFSCGCFTFQIPAQIETGQLYGTVWEQVVT